jgi:hypothetical protein
MEHSSRLKIDNTSAAIIVTNLEEDRYMTGNYDANTVHQKLHPKKKKTISGPAAVGSWSVGTQYDNTRPHIAHNNKTVLIN